MQAQTNMENKQSLSASSQILELPKSRIELFPNWLKARSTFSRMHSMIQNVMKRKKRKVTISSKLSQSYMSTSSWLTEVAQ